MNGAGGLVQMPITLCGKIYGAIWRRGDGDILLCKNCRYKKLGIRRKYFIAHPFDTEPIGL